MVLILVRPRSRHNKHEPAEKICPLSALFIGIGPIGLHTHARVYETTQKK